MFESIGKIFGSKDVISSAMNGIDAIVFTDQERAELKIKLLKQYEPFKIAQRYIAVIFSLSYVFAFLLALVFNIVGWEIKGILDIVKEFSIGYIVLAIVSFYFSGGAIEAFKNKNKD